MSRIVDPSPIKAGSGPLTGRKRQGLRKLSPDLITKATDETIAQVTRIGLTFLGTALFCLLSLFSPDSALLGDSEKINLPLAGPVSFFGFMLLGPAVLIMLRVYLQIYVEHSNRLERLRSSMLAVRTPTLAPLNNPLIRVFSGLIFYAVLPMTMIFFVWKAAVFPDWGAGLLCVAVGVVASHALLPLDKLSWRSRALLSVGAAIIAGGVILGFGPLRRPFDLYHANLSQQWLGGNNLSGAILGNANLTGADLFHANLTGANLFAAKLTDASVAGATLTGAHLYSAKLSRANLSGTNLSGANLLFADLSGANLIGATLTGATLFRASLNSADLSRATLTGANLDEANLDGANLTDALLSDANLAGANLTGAKLSRAKLSRANLFGANLSGANLTGADLTGANLSANLSGANLTDAVLSNARLNEACGTVNTKLPEGFTVKPCPVGDKK